MIEIKNLSYKFDKRFYVLYDVTLTIKSQEKIVINSNNFLDTQMLFRIVSKQDKDYTGEIYFDDVSLKKTKLKDLSISYIAKTPFLLNNKSVLYNIAYPLMVRKSKKVEALKLANQILIKFNHQNLQDKKIKELSHYEKIIVSILRAIIRTPKYIFVEDIFEELNKEQIEEVVGILNLLPTNTTLIVSTNNEYVSNNINFTNTLSFTNGTLNTINNNQNKDTL